MQIVERGILEQDDAGRNLDAVENDVEGRSLTRAIRFPVGQRVRDVFVSAQRVEVVLVVVVERRLIAQPLPARVWVVVDLKIERVVVHVDGARTCHTSILEVGPLLNQTYVPP